MAVNAVLFTTFKVAMGCKEYHLILLYVSYILHVCKTCHLHVH